MADWEKIYFENKESIIAELEQLYIREAAANWGAEYETDPMDLPLLGSDGRIYYEVEKVPDGFEVLDLLGFPEVAFSDKTLVSCFLNLYPDEAAAMDIDYSSYEDQIRADKDLLDLLEDGAYNPKNGWDFSDKTVAVVRESLTRDEGLSGYACVDGSKDGKPNYLADYLSDLEVWVKSGHNNPYIF